MKLLILTDHAAYGGVSKASDALQKCFDSEKFDVRRYAIYDKSYGLLGRIVSILKAVFYLLSHDFNKIVLMHFEAIFVGLLCRPFRTKNIFIYTIHTDLYGYYSEAPFLKKMVLRLVLRLLRDDSIVFDSKESELRAKKYFGFSKTKTIYNIVAPALTSPPKLDGGTFKFGSVSRLHSGKNIDLLIRVFNSFWMNHRDTKLSIYGDGPELRKLQEYARIFPCAHAITFEGYANNPDEIYSQIDCLVGFSSMEGFGLVILEALLRNIPVLYSDCSCGPREILSPNSDPCLKTDAYEVGKGGVLVKIPTKTSPYAPHLQNSEQIVLEAFLLIYKNFKTIKMESFLDLERFSPNTIKRQWMDFLFE